MLGNQKCKVCILCLLLITLIAMSVYSDDTIRILIYHNSIWIHTEGSDIIFEFLCTIYNLAFI